LLPFSSGTTGRPKGVELTARAMYACAARVSALEEQAAYMLAVLPFFHIAATMIFHVTIFKGMAMVVLPRFEPGSFLRAIERYKLDTVNVVPPIVQFLAKHPLVDKYDLSLVTRLGSGAAPLGDELATAVHNRLGLPVLQSYGMTELAGTATHSSLEEFRNGASGKLLPNTELRVRCLDTGEDLPPNQHGELLVRSPGAMKGYFNDPEATREAFTDGFLRTGDVGFIDQDGYIFIVDRLKELIKYKGHQVAPAELEDVINSHPQVADSCCVRGVDLDTGDEIPKAFVALQFTGGEPLTPGRLMEYVASKVAGFKRVREVEFVDAIPRSVAGKILRRKLQLEQDKKGKAILSRL
jgi:4-coumarate--CoA ligase